MLHAVLIFPNQLFFRKNDLALFDIVVLFEDPLFFFDSVYKVKFQKKKLVLHRASMRFFFDTLSHPQKQYVSWESQTSLEKLIKDLVQTGVKKISTPDPVDYILKKRLVRAAKKHAVQLVFVHNASFLNTAQDNQRFLDRQGKKKLFFTTFYIDQRQRLKILLEPDGSPVGGKWSFDTENRKKIPKKVKITTRFSENLSPYVKEAQKYVERNFADHIGNTKDFFYPVTHEQAQEWLQVFLQDRFENFGAYEDAIDTQNHFLLHSLLSAPLNIGLITPQEIVHAVLEYFSQHPQVSLSSVEGFLRQIIGWREYIRLVYEKFGVQQRNSNSLGHSRKLSSAWYTAQTLLPPVDAAIQSAVETGYTHHIERLMVLGNLMLLAEVHPDEVYNWFMEVFIDAYDWVMVPNVYGMSQFADGGLMTTKPYFSSSNYVFTMSHYERGDWTSGWDGLFWQFVEKKADLLRKNIRSRFLVLQLEKMDPQKRVQHEKSAKMLRERLST